MRRILFVLGATLSISWQGFSQDIEGLSSNAIKLVKEVQYHGNLDQFVMPEDVFKFYAEFKGNQFTQEMYEAYKSSADKYLKSICSTHMAENFEMKDFSTSNISIKGNSRDKIYSANINVEYLFNTKDKTTELTDLLWIKGKWYVSASKDMGLAMIGLSQDKICMCVTMEQKMELELDLAGDDENQIKQIEDNYESIEKECRDLGDKFSAYFEELTDKEKEEVISSIEKCMEELPKREEE